VPNVAEPSGYYERMLLARSGNPVAKAWRLYLNMVRGRAQLKEWRARGYGLPAPYSVKIEVLLRRGDPEATWIETGTYLGETTHVLGRRAKHVFTIEPAVALAERARERFNGRANITVIEGPSELMLEPLLRDIQGDVCFWLDGHFSSGPTFQGTADTPIVEELDIIERNLTRLGRVVILVDDIRCFRSGDEGMTSYPTRSSLVEWADRLSFSWEIEQDIFIATRATSS